MPFSATRTTTAATTIKRLLDSSGSWIRQSSQPINIRGGCIRRLVHTSGSSPTCLPCVSAFFSVSSPWSRHNKLHSLVNMKKANNILSSFCVVKEHRGIHSMVCVNSSSSLLSSSLLFKKKKETTTRMLHRTWSSSIVPAGVTKRTVSTTMDYDDANDSSSSFSFSTPTREDVEQLSQLLDQEPGSLLTTLHEHNNDDNNDDDDSLSLLLDRYNVDWTRKYRGHAAIVVKPRTVDQVARIVDYCQTRRIPIVPQGGNTGLVGGSIPSSSHSNAQQTPKSTNNKNNHRDNNHNHNRTSNEIVLSLERLNQIYNVDAVTGILYCQAGCILQELQDYTSKNYNLLVPVDLGAKGTCQIGGNLATNAGGQYYYRHGPLLANVVGMQVVWANQNQNHHPTADKNNNNKKAHVAHLNFTPTTNTTTTSSSSSSSSSSSKASSTSTNASEPQQEDQPQQPISYRSNLKDNTGYKLAQLMIGSEGTLGIITGVALKCHALPASRQAAFLACHSFEQVIQVITTAKQELGEILAAMEWMDQSILQTIQHHLRSNQSKLTIPILTTMTTDNDATVSTPYPHSILVETHGSCAEHDIEKLDRFLEKVMADSNDEENATPIMVQDGVVAQDLTQVHNFWQVREMAGVAISELGYGYKYDVSLPVEQFWKLSQEVQQQIQTHYYRNDNENKGKNQKQQEVLCTNFGHILDGNLHLNFTTPGRNTVDETLLQCLEPFVFDQVLQRGGSISAEHGIGQFKREYMTRIHSPQTLATMRALKQVFDPTGIFNPHKVLPSKDNNNNDDGDDDSVIVQQ